MCVDLLTDNVEEKIKMFQDLARKTYEELF